MCRVVFTTLTSRSFRGRISFIAVQFLRIHWFVQTDSHVCARSSGVESDRRSVGMISCCSFDVDGMMLVALYIKVA